MTCDFFNYKPAFPFGFWVIAAIAMFGIACWLGQTFGVPLCE